MAPFISRVVARESVTTTTFEDKFRCSSRWYDAALVDGTFAFQGGNDGGCRYVLVGGGQSLVSLLMRFLDCRVIVADQTLYSSAVLSSATPGLLLMVDEG